MSMIEKGGVGWMDGGEKEERKKFEGGGILRDTYTKSKVHSGFLGFIG